MSQEQGGTIAEADKAKKTVTIIVNAREYAVEKDVLSYEEVVALYENRPTGPNWYFNVTYRRGHGDKPQGSLEPGQSVRIKHGMIFDVTPTDRS